MSTEVFSSMLGKTIMNIQISDQKDEMIFISSDKIEFKFYHYHDCCESVTIEDICGELNDLIGSPLLIAECVISDDKSLEKSSISKYDYNHIDELSYTWSFYKFSTIKGSVTVRWYGASNGYYSERVDFCETKQESQ